MKCCKCSAEYDEDNQYGGDENDEDDFISSNCCGIFYCQQCFWKSKLNECPNPECKAIDNTCSGCNRAINLGIMSSYLVRCTLCDKTQVLCDVCSRGVHGKKHCTGERIDEDRRKFEYGYLVHID